jgi:CubicO group peptidase (beta-lactamase class C family)
MMDRDVRGWCWSGLQRWLSLAFAGSTTIGCGASGAPVAATPESAANVAHAQSVETLAVSFEPPNNLAPAQWLVLGPFPRGDRSADAALDHDYLAPIGGEPATRIEASTTLEVGGKRLSVTPFEADPERGVDLKAFFKDGADLQVAYAYGEIDWPRDEVVEATFGSDDGAAVWVNGRRVHRLVTPGRGVSPDSDRFEVALSKGVNRVLLKIENGSGEWGFSLTLRDRESQERARSLAERRHLEDLELGPASGSYLLEDEFPRLEYGRARAAWIAFGDEPLRVRWFDPELKEVQRPEAQGRYIAVIEQKTRDGYTHRAMLTFAKVGAGQLPFTELPRPPLAEPAPLAAQFFPGLSEAQRGELSRHVWRALADYLNEGENAAIARSRLVELGAAPTSTGEPSWLASGFIHNAERQLALRLSLEGRTPKRLEPPAAASPRAPELRMGSEREAGIAPGTIQRLRAVGKDWLKHDPNGFVVLLARRGVVFMHEAFGGFQKEERFRPASIGKLIAGLTFARAVDQGLVGFDDPVSSVFPEWQHERTARVTFRHCFNHIAGLPAHVSHRGLFNPYLDNAFLVQDSAFVEPLKRHRYNGDSYNLTGKALELLTGKSIWRLLYENVQKPFGEPVTQFDLGFGERFTARYLAEVGQMLLQDGSYGAYRFYSPGFLAKLRPERVADHAPGFADRELEWGIGQTWTPDPSSGPRQQGALGPNVFGHGAASGSIFRVDPDHQLVVVIGRNAHRGWGENERWAATFIKALAEGLREAKPADKPLPVASRSPG